MAFTQVRFILSGLPSGLGYTTFRWDGELNATDASTAAANARTLLNAFVAAIPSGSTYTSDSSATTHQDTGVLISDVPLTTVPGPITNTGAGSYAGGAGFSITWQTAAVVVGKRVRGRTYIAPVVASIYDTGGTLATTQLNAYRTAATTFANSIPRPVVWSRRPGGIFAVSQMSGATIADKVALIKSRRD